MVQMWHMSKRGNQKPANESEENPLVGSSPIPRDPANYLIRSSKLGGEAREEQSLEEGGSTSSKQKKRKGSPSPSKGRSQKISQGGGVGKERKLRRPCRKEGGGKGSGRLKKSTGVPL